VSRAHRISDRGGNAADQGRPLPTLPFLAEGIAVLNLDWLLRKGPVLMLCSHPVASRGGAVAFDEQLA